MKGALGVEKVGEGGRGTLEGRKGMKGDLFLYCLHIF